MPHINIKTCVNNQNNCNIILNINWSLSKKNIYAKRLKSEEKVIRDFHIKSQQLKYDAVDRNDAVNILQ